MKITHVLTGTVGCLLAVAAQSALAKIPVYVFGNTPNDPIGTYITAQVRNQIANSPTLTLVNDMNQAVARLNLQGADPTREGRFTAIAENVDIVNAASPVNPWLNIQQHIRICLSESSGSCATTIVNDLTTVALQYGPQLQQKLGR